MNKIFWLDLETGGLNPQVCQITQIAAVATDMDFNPIEEFNVTVKLIDKAYTQQALDVQGYSPEGAVDIRKAMFLLANFAAKHTNTLISKRTGKSYPCAELAGYNPRFDADFLKATKERYGDHWIPITTWVGGFRDVLQLAKWVEIIAGVKFPSFKLADLASELGLPEFEAHDALNDTRAAIDVTKKLIGMLK